MKILGIEFDKTFGIQFIIVLIIISLGALIIHVRDNVIINYNALLLWLPITWLMTFGLVLIFGSLTMEKN